MVCSRRCSHRSHHIFLPFSYKKGTTKAGQHDVQKKHALDQQKEVKDVTLFTQLMQWLLRIGSGFMVACFLGFAWGSTALAAGGVGDADSFDGDEVNWPLLVLGALALVGVLLTFLVIRSRRSARSENRNG